MKFQNMEAGFKAELKRAEEERSKLGDINKELLAEVILGGCGITITEFRFVTAFFFLCTFVS